MPDKRKHRGQHPADFYLFTTESETVLQFAVRDLSWLLSRGYSQHAGLQLVGNRFELNKRQRMAVRRCACSDSNLNYRNSHSIPESQLTDKDLFIDGFNLLITVESALSRGILLKGRDGCIRDLASIHGTYKKVMETEVAIHLIGRFLEKHNLRTISWFLDSPVSNSGRMKTLLRKVAKEQGWNWEVFLHSNPDVLLKKVDGIVVSSDSEILNVAERWTNLADFIISSLETEENLLTLA
ncbi:MAG: DUF434 domain-containing protein [Bacteroidetes bacterium]|nr:DUF434 domain-containing protein [Bacteroidota bacterium]